MIQIDLITGFLGSGKTTFLKKYARRLMEQGMHIGILENDYGAVNVDMMLLSDLQGEQCDLSMVAGGCDADCHKRRFKTKLIAMGMSGYDRVLIEPSGIFDVDEFFDVLCEEPLCRWYEIGNVIAIVDAGLEPELSPASEYMLASQTAHAGKILLSKCQDSNREEQERTISHMNQALRNVQCQRNVDRDILAKNWESLTEADWNDIFTCGYRKESYVKLALAGANAYSTLYYMNLPLSKNDMNTIAGQLFQDPSFGNIFRIKGFIKTEEEQWLQVNATRTKMTMEPIENGQEVIIVIGENLENEKIDSFFYSIS